MGAAGAWQTCRLSSQPQSQTSESWVSIWGPQGTGIWQRCGARSLKSLEVQAKEWNLILGAVRNHEMLLNASVRFLNSLGALAPAYIVPCPQMAGPALSFAPLSVADGLKLGTA